MAPFTARPFITLDNGNKLVLGFGVRKQLAQTTIFRIRRGNGVYGAVLGRRYQDQYAYVVPSSINNTEGQPARNTLTAAVAAWQALTEAQKDLWRSKERRIKGTSGYALFIRQYFKDNYNG